MSDPNRPSNPDDLKQRLGIGGGDSAPPDSSQPGAVPPPAVGGSGAVPPPSVGGSGAVPPPTVGGSGAVPPPSLGGSNVPAPFLGKPQLDVAPPPFAAKKKKEKKVRRIVEEIYEDEGPVVDSRAKARRRKLIIICAAIAVPIFLGLFFVGKSRQGWALNAKSREDAAKLLKTVNEARPILEDVQTKTQAALTKGKNGQVDEGYSDYTLEMTEKRPVTNSHVDMLNYATFDPDTVDMGFELMRVCADLWSEMTTHRGVTRTDLDALKTYSKLGVPRNQILLGVLLMNLDRATYGANVGILSHPSKNDEGEPTYDMQTRTGRRPHQFKLYTSGELGEDANEWVIPVDPSQTTKGAPLENAEETHWEEYMDRLNTIDELASKSINLQGILAQKLQAVAGG